jgi:UV DNA damage repair endonuclease
MPKIRRETPPFASPGLQARDNLAFLRAFTPQWHEKTSHKVSKSQKSAQKIQKTNNKRTFTALVFELDFEVPLYRISTPQVPEMFTQRLVKTTPL